MKRKLVDNILLILIIFGMLTLAFFSLFLMTKDSAYATDIDNQNKQTNNPNVTFDAGFEPSAGSPLTHSIIANINPEYPYLRLQIGLASGCTLINPQVQFYDSANTSDVNFDLGFGRMTSPYIKNSNDTNKTITFNDLTTGLNFGCQMGADFGNMVKIAKLDETSKVVFTATCRDANGNTTPVQKEIYFNVGWTANLEMSVYQKVREFNHIPTTDEIVVKTEVTSKVNFAGKHNILPVKFTELIVTVPEFKGIAPTSVSVSATKTLATNGQNENNVTFNSSNYSYNASTGKLTITVQNPNTSGIVPSVRGSDEYIITYTYPKAAYDLFDNNPVSLTNQIDASMDFYGPGLTAIGCSSSPSPMVLKNFTSNNTSGTLYKSDLYFNTLKNTYAKNNTYSYILTHEIKEMGSGNFTEKTEFGPVQFVADSTTYNAYTNGRNYVPITKLEFPVSSFNSYLGSSGYIKIYAGSTLLTTITSSSPTITLSDGTVCYSFDIPAATQTSSEKIFFINSSPLAEHVTLETYVHRAISVDLPNTIQQIQQFKKSTELITFYDAKASAPDNYEQRNALTWENIANDTYSNASLNVITPSLKAQGGEQDLELNILLDNKQVNTDIWKTPSFDIVLPEYIKNVDKTIQVGVNINPSQTVSMGTKFHSQLVNGQWHIALPFIGTQQARFNPQTIITVKMKVTVDKYAPNMEKDIQVYYINSLAYKYLNSATWQLTPATTGSSNITFPIFANNTPCGVADGTINFTTTPNLLCVSELTNYNGSDTINSMDNQDTAAPIGKGSIRPKMNLTIQNNHTVPVSGVTILGRIPYTNNKYAISNNDLGTNINTQLNSRLTQVGSSVPSNDMTIYYSDNLNATTDLSLSSNHWVTSPSNLSDVKSYMIVINSTLAVGQQVKFTYDFSVPDNLKAGKSLFANFGATYTTNGTTNSSESGKIGLTTGQAPSLTATKTSSVANGATVKEGDIITYTITVKNTGSVAANNVVLTDNIPANTTYAEKNGSNYTPVPTKKTITENIGTLATGASHTYSFSVVVGEITANTNIKNVATISADGIDPISSNDCTVSAITSKSNITLTKKSNIPNGGSVKSGDQITYTITARNTGNGTAKNVIIHDNIPKNTTYVDPSTGKQDPQKQKVSSPKRDTLKPGETFEFTFTVVVNQLSQTTNIENTATLDCDDGSTNTSNKVVISATPNYPNLKVEKTSSIAPGATVKEGDLITYTITVKNEGTSPASNIAINDTVPEHTTLYENNKRVPEKTKVGKTIGVLDPGQTESYSFTVIVDEIPANTTIKNTAKVTADNSPDIPTNTVGIGAEISVPSLKLEKTSSIIQGSTIKSGDIITYTITVHNDGDAIAHNVVISDTVPTNTIYVEKVGSKYIKDTAKTSISKTIETLKPGEKETLVFSVMVDTLSSDVVITNTAKVNANHSPEIPSNVVGITAKPKSNSSGGNLPFAGHYSILIILALTTLSIGGFTVYQYRKNRKGHIMKF